MKAAVIGTQNAQVSMSATDILKMLATSTLQRHAGYVPPAMPLDIYELPPIHPALSQLSDEMFSLLLNENILGSNPRVPYVLIAWVLAGTDHLFWMRSTSFDGKYLLCRVAQTMLLTAMGDSYDYTKYNLSDFWVFNARVEGQTAKLAISAMEKALQGQQDDAVDLAFYAIRSPLNMVSSFTKQQKVLEQIESRAREWCYFDDQTISGIIRNLMLDTLDMKRFFKP